MYYGGNFYGYGGGYYGGHDWSGYADKSQAAQRRENAAREKFTEALQTRSIPGDGSLTISPFLNPSEHLTGACWTDFNRWVKTHDGCKAKRRGATAEEKAAHKVTRQGKAYWVDITLTASAQSAAGFAPKKTTKRPASADDENADAQGATKKAKKPKATAA